MDMRTDTTGGKSEAVGRSTGSEPPANYSDWLKLRPLITRELLTGADVGLLQAAAALKRVCRQLFGADCSARDETRFLIFAAPIARKIAINQANRDERIGGSNVRVQDLVEWFGWLDRFDPLCASMIDLHYIAGLTAKQTAAALRLPAATVIRDLRFAKAWLQTKLI